MPWGFNQIYTKMLFNKWELCYISLFATHQKAWWLCSRLNIWTMVLKILNNLYFHMKFTSSFMGVPRWFQRSLCTYSKPCDPERTPRFFCLNTAKQLLSWIFEVFFFSNKVSMKGTLLVFLLKLTLIELWLWVKCWVKCLMHMFAHLISTIALWGSEVSPSSFIKRIRNDESLSSLFKTGHKVINGRPEIQTQVWGGPIIHKKKLGLLFCNAKSIK